MFTIKIWEGELGHFKEVDDAIKYMIDCNYEGEVSVYDVNTDKAYFKATRIYNEIKKYNKGKPLDDQILPSNPYGFRGILGCLGVQVYSISLGTYKRNHEMISVFSGWNPDVLDTSVEKADISPGSKAIVSLMINKNGIV